MNTFLFSAIVVAFLIMVFTLLIFYGRKSGWFAVMFVLTGLTALILSIFTDLNWFITVLNMVSAALFLIWIMAINRAKKGDSNDNNVYK